MSDMYTYRLKRKLRRFSIACLTRAHFHVRRVGLCAPNKPNLGINQTFALHNAFGTCAQYPKSIHWQMSPPHSWLYSWLGAKSKMLDQWPFLKYRVRNRRDSDSQGPLPHLPFWTSTTWKRNKQCTSGMPLTSSSSYGAIACAVLAIVTWVFWPRPASKKSSDYDPKTGLGRGAPGFRTYPYTDPRNQCKARRSPC